MYEAQLRPEISQGDILRDVPIPYVYYAADGGFLTRPDGTPIPPALHRGRAMILNRDCDYDKSEWILVAEVRRLDEVAQNSRGNVRKYRTRNTFYLEGVPGVMNESYVDFRRMDRLAKSMIQEIAATGRVLSLRSDARLALQYQLAIFFGYDASES